VPRPEDRPAGPDAPPARLDRADPEASGHDAPDRDPAPAPAGTIRPAAPVKGAEVEKVEREMRARRELEEAARLDGFLGQIRSVLGDVPNLPRRREEVEGMLSAAGKIAGARQAEVEALRAEFSGKLQEAAFEALMAPLRQKAGDTVALLNGRAEVERMLAEAEKEAGARKPEVDALRTEIARKIEEASKPWRFAFGFEEGFEKELLKVDDWKGLKYTEEPRNVRSGRRAVCIGPGGVGAGFWIGGVKEGLTYVMSCWSRRGLEGGEAWVGFEFFGEGDKRLTKDIHTIKSGGYPKFTVQVQAPRGTTRLLLWLCTQGKGEYFADDVEVVLKQP